MRVSSVFVKVSVSVGRVTVITGSRSISGHGGYEVWERMPIPARGVPRGRVRLALFSAMGAVGEKSPPSVRIGGARGDRATSKVAVTNVLVRVRSSSVTRISISRIFGRFRKR